MKIKAFLIKYNIELPILLTVFLFALAGDLIYGGAVEAEASLVGILLASTSVFLYTVFTIVVLFRLVTGFFASNKFYNWMSNFPCHQPQDDSVIKPIPKKQWNLDY